MPKPIFENNEHCTFLWAGLIDRVDAENVGWGTADNGRTFDVPLPENYGLGTRAEYYLYEWPDNPEATHGMVLRTPSRMIVLMISETDEGLELIGSSDEFTRPN